MSKKIGTVAFAAMVAASIVGFASPASAATPTHVRRYFKNFTVSVADCKNMVNNPVGSYNVYYGSIVNHSGRSFGCSYSNGSAHAHYKPSAIYRSDRWAAATHRFEISWREPSGATIICGYLDLPSLQVGTITNTFNTQWNQLYFDRTETFDACGIPIKVSVKFLEGWGAYS